MEAVWILLGALFGMTAAWVGVAAFLRGRKGTVPVPPRTRQPHPASYWYHCAPDEYGITRESPLEEER